MDGIDKVERWLEGFAVVIEPKETCRSALEVTSVTSLEIKSDTNEVKSLSETKSDFDEVKSSSENKSGTSKIELSSRASSGKLECEKEFLDSVISKVGSLFVKGSHSSKASQIKSKLVAADINNNHPFYFEKLFHSMSMLQESFKKKLEDKIKLQAFNLWLQCVDYQFSTGECKVEKRNELVKKIAQKDSVFSFNDKNKLVDSGIVHVKGSVFMAFQAEFAAFLKSMEFKTLVEETNSDSCKNSGCNNTGSVTGSVFEANSVTSSHDQCSSDQKIENAELNVEDCKEISQNLNKTQRSNHSCSSNTTKTGNCVQKDLPKSPEQTACSESTSGLSDKQLSDSKCSQNKASFTPKLRDVKQNPLNASRATICSSKRTILTKHDKSKSEHKLPQKCFTSKRGSFSTLRSTNQNPLNASRTTISTSKRDFSNKYDENKSKDKLPRERFTSKRGNTSKLQRRTSTVSRSASRMSQAPRVNRRPSCETNIMVIDKTFQFNPVVQEIFKVKLYKLDNKKYLAYKLWLKCIDYHFSAEKAKEGKRIDVFKTFVAEDDVFDLNVHQRRRLMESGVYSVKKTAFEVFKNEFLEFVSSLLYKNSCKLY